MKTPMLLLLLTAGCSATGYHRANSAGGFEESQLSEDTLRVSFGGNTYTSRTQAEDFALLRASELCLSGRYPYFLVLSKGDQTQVGYSVSQYAVYRREWPRINITIKCVDHKLSERDELLDAAMIRNGMRTKYEIE
jgi:hypothetical protein